MKSILVFKGQLVNRLMFAIQNRTNFFQLESETHCVNKKAVWKLLFVMHLVTDFDEKFHMLCQNALCPLEKVTCVFRAKR